MITGDLPPFARSGQAIDVQVSSLGNARSLQGGTLLMSPLLGPDGEVYALAQGPLSVGGYEVRGGRGVSETRNHVTVGRIPEGAIIERELEVNLSQREELRLILRRPDFSTAVEVARGINESFPTELLEEEAVVPEGEAGMVRGRQPTRGVAEAIDASTIRVTIPPAFASHVPQFIALVELLEVRPSRVARVVINERTGTVVLGGDVRISEVAIAHGNLTVSIDTQFGVSQPMPLGRGTTEVTASTEIDVREERGGLSLVPEAASIADVVSALNAIGASPRDLIAILQAIKTAGALNAELVID
jgi:flagellar P-ring protein precursor FlgI